MFHIWYLTILASACLATVKVVSTFLWEQPYEDILTWICLMAGVYSVKRDVISRTVFSLRDVRKGNTAKSFQQYFYNRYKIVVYTGLRNDSIYSSNSHLISETLITSSHFFTSSHGTM
jgi:hypothetical protein